jgi:hypothetical protein
VTTPFYLALRAEGFALDGRVDEGLGLLEQALAIVDRMESGTTKPKSAVYSGC